MDPLIEKQRIIGKYLIESVVVKKELFDNSAIPCLKTHKIRTL